MEEFLHTILFFTMWRIKVFLVHYIHDYTLIWAEIAICGFIVMHSCTASQRITGNYSIGNHPYTATVKTLKMT